MTLTTTQLADRFLAAADQGIQGRRLRLANPYPKRPVCPRCRGRGWEGTGRVDEFGNWDAWTCDSCDGLGLA